VNGLPPLFAHGEILLLFKSIILQVALVIACFINGTLALAIGGLVSWKALKGKSRRTRILIGLLVAAVIFVVLAIVELGVALALIEVPRPSDS